MVVHIDFQSHSELDAVDVCAAAGLDPLDGESKAKVERSERVPYRALGISILSFDDYDSQYAVLFTVA